MRESLEWTLLVATGALLSVQIARRVTDVFARVAAEAPVRAVVADALAESEERDSPIVQAFAEALESPGNGVGAAR
jgi:hypothetical protein